MAWNSRAQSATVRAIGPTWSSVGHRGTTPALVKAPRGRLEPGHPAERGRDAQRPEGVRRHGRRDHAGGQCGSGPARSAARRAAEIPGVAHLVGRRARTELMGVQVPEEHRFRSAHLGPDCAVLRRDLTQEAARRGERLAGRREEVLEPDRNAAERRRRAVSLDGVATSPVVRPGRRGPGVVGIDAHPRVDGFTIAVVAMGPVPVLDPLQACLDEVARGDRAGGQRGGGRGEVEVGRVGDRIRGHAAGARGSRARRRAPASRCTS